MVPIQVMQAAGIPAAMRLKEAAGWNQTEQDWRNLLRMAPEGCFAIEQEGTLVASTTAVTFRRELAWIGMVLTHPEFRGRGYARRLMEHALAYLRERGAEWIKLDATEIGRPLYRKLGFEDEGAIERWGRVAEAAPVASELEPFRCEAWRELDRAAFGADRSELLETLAPLGSAAVQGEAYGMWRPGARGAYFGPCVSRSAEAVRSLAEAWLACHAGRTVYWDLLPVNREAVRLARAFGFEPVRRLTRMALPGPHPLPHDDSLVFAIAGFEYG